MKKVAENDDSNLDTDVVKLIRKITESNMQEEAFYVCDIDDVIQKYHNWVKKMPRVTPYYAVKCNEYHLVLKILASLGAGFDCASKAEIEKILALGVDSSRIIFANPTKLPSHVRFAAEHNIEMTTFDNENELKKIKTIHPKSKLILRIRSDAKIVQYRLGVKFGCDAYTEGPDLLKLARKMDLQVIGICFHVGSGCGEIAAFNRGIAAASFLFRIGSGLGFNMRIVDIGGGYPGDKGTSIDDFSQVINESLDRHFPDNNDIQIIAEPGRYFVASAFTSAAMIHSKHEIKDAETKNTVKNVYYLNDGIYGSFTILSFQDVVLNPIPLKKNNFSEKKKLSTILGPTSNDLDVVADNIELPDLEIGDWLMFENMGAYTSSTSTVFNQFPITKIYPHSMKKDALNLLF